MTNNGIKKFVGVCISAVMLYFFIGVNINFSVARSIISNLTHYFPFIITGFICLLFGINERKFGSMIFGVVSVMLLSGSF